MKSLIFIFFSLLLMSCSTGKETTGPLSKLDHFEVYVLISPNLHDSQRSIMEEIHKELNSIGHIVSPLESKSITPALFISIAEEGKVLVYADVSITKNGYEKACTIWDSTTQGIALPMPELKGGQVTFTTPIEQSLDPKLVVQTTLEKFAKQYSKDNPKSANPIFYLQP